MEHTLYSYARLSRDDPPGVEKIPQQHRDNRAEIARLGRTCAGELEDDGLSGELGERWRKGLHSLLESWRQGTSGGVVARDLGRLSRNTDLDGQIFQLARETRSEVITRLDDASNREARRSKAQGNEQLITWLRKVCGEKFALRAHQGLYPGGRSVFGTRWVRDCSDSEALQLRIRRQPVPYRKDIIPDEAERLVRAVEIVEDGGSIGSAARSIGVIEARLARILRNPAIAGAHAYGRTMTIPDTPLRTKAGTTPIVVWGVHQEIISPVRWAALQVTLDGLTAGRAGPTIVPLSNQLVCGTCGAPVEIYCGPLRHGQRYRYSRCTGPSHCVHAEVSRWPQSIAASLAERLTDPDVARQIAEEYSASQRVPRRRRSDGARLARAERAVLDLASDGTIDAAEARRRLAPIRSELESLRSAERRDRDALRLPGPEEIRAALLRAAATLRAGMDDEAALRSALTRMLKEVRVTGPKSANLVPAWRPITCTGDDTHDSSFVRMYYQRTFDAITATPLLVEDVIAGEWLWGATKSLVAGAIMVVMVSFFRQVHWPAGLLVIPLALLGGLLFSALGLVTTALVPQIDNFNVSTFLVIFPMFLFSGTFFPLEILPGWAMKIALVLPLTHLSSLLRGACLSQEPPYAWASLAYLLAVTILAFGAAVLLMRRRLVK